MKYFIAEIMFGKLANPQGYYASKGTSKLSKMLKLAIDEAKKKGPVKYIDSAPNIGPEDNPITVIAEVDPKKDLKRFLDVFLYQYKDAKGRIFGITKVTK